MLHYVFWSVEFKSSANKIIKVYSKKFPYGRANSAAVGEMLKRNHLLEADRYPQFSFK